MLVLFVQREDEPMRSGREKGIAPALLRPPFVLEDILSRPHLLLLARAPLLLKELSPSASRPPHLCSLVLPLFSVQVRQYSTYPSVPSLGCALSVDLASLIEKWVVMLCYHDFSFWEERFHLIAILLPFIFIPNRRCSCVGGFVFARSVAGRGIRDRSLGPLAAEGIPERPFSGLHNAF